MAITKETGLADGAILTLVGITVISAPLAILTWLRQVLRRVFAEKDENLVAAVEEVPSIVSQKVEEPPPGEVVAVIALALSLAQAESSRAAPRKEIPSAALPSLWAIYGRQQIMNSRGRTRQKW